MLNCGKLTFSINIFKLFKHCLLGLGSLTGKFASVIFHPYNLSPISSCHCTQVFLLMWTKLQNTDRGCAICPCIGCNHELFCAVGHFSFVLWLLKMDQSKIYLVWKTTLLLSTGLLSELCASGGTFSLFVSHFLFIYILSIYFILIIRKSATYYLLNLQGLCYVTQPCQ